MPRRLALALATSALALLLLAGAAGANVPVGATSWHWGSPFPQGEEIQDLSFAGTTGFAIDATNATLKTTDGGRTWSLIRHADDLSGFDPYDETSAPIGEVQAFSANDVLVGDGCVLARSSDGGATFTEAHIPGSSDSCEILEMSFVSPTVGWVMTVDDVVLSTTDGGRHFTKLARVPRPVATPIPTDDEFVDAIRLASPTTGFASADKKLYRTTDGGRSWQLVATAGRSLGEMVFADPTHGYALGEGGLVLRTADGGTTWTRDDLGFEHAAAWDVDCPTATVCLFTLDTSAGSHQRQWLVRTVDGRVAGPRVALPDGTNAVAAASLTSVVAAGAAGAIAVSDDGGASFHRVDTRVPRSFTGIRVGAVPGSAFALGKAGGLAKTVDGGRHWQAVAVRGAARLVDVSFSSAAAGDALDARGRLLRTTDGGATWTRLPAHGGGRANALVAHGAHGVLLIGTRGVRRSANGGRTFAAAHGGRVASAHLSHVALARGSTIVAWGPSALVRSADGGRTWRALRLPPFPHPRRGWSVLDAAFTSPRDGYIVLGFKGSGGELWRTSDSGRHWHFVATPGAAFGDVDGVAVGARHVVAAITTRAVLRSTNSGATWTVETLPDDVRIALASDTWYALMDNTGLLFTTNGGVAGRHVQLTIAGPHRIARPGTITVRGRMSPARPGAVVDVDGVGVNHHRPSAPTHVAADGTFSVRLRLDAPEALLTAAYDGDRDTNGATSRVLKVAVGKR